MFLNMEGGWSCVGGNRCVGWWVTVGGFWVAVPYGSEDECLRVECAELTGAVLGEGSDGTVLAPPSRMADWYGSLSSSVCVHPASCFPLLFWGLLWLSGWLQTFYNAHRRPPFPTSLTAERCKDTSEYCFWGVRT